MHHEIHPPNGSTTSNREAGVVLVRPVALEDEEGLRGMLSRLSRESLYLRFHAPYPRAPEWAVASFADSNRPDGESLVAVANGEIVGHAMYSQGADEAEFAVVVEDGWQARGVGKALLRALAARARDRGVEIYGRRAAGEPAHARPGPLRVRRGRVRDQGRCVPGERAAANARTGGEPRSPGRDAPPWTFGVARRPSKVLREDRTFPRCRHALSGSISVQTMR